MSDKPGWNRDCETYGEANIKLMSIHKTGQGSVLYLSSSEEGILWRVLVNTIIQFRDP